LHGRSIGHFTTLKAEEPLNLSPGDEREVGRQNQQREQDHPETQPGQAALADPVFARTATGSMEAVRAIDRSRIEWRRVLDGITAPGRLGHAGTI
jgi:hypothetical protein